MKRSAIQDAVLFSVEKGTYPYKYRLFFAVNFNNGEKPSLHRFFVRSKKIFDGFRLGGIYDIEYSGIRIVSAKNTGMYPFTDSEYFELVRQRDQRFMEAKAQKQFGVKSIEYTPAELYYSFKVFKSLVEYRPAFLKILVVNLCKLACYMLSFFIPIALYLLAIYFFSSSSGFLASGKTAFTVPTASVCILPFIIWMMCMLYSLINILLLNIPYLRNYMLKTYTLRWAGMRKSCYIENDLRKSLLKSGLITFGIAAVSVAVSIIL